MNDFVITKSLNQLKLVDLDDVILEEKTCRNDGDCVIPTASLARTELLFKSKHSCRIKCKLQNIVTLHISKSEILLVCVSSLAHVKSKNILSNS